MKGRSVEEIGAERRGKGGCEVEVLVLARSGRSALVRLPHGPVYPGNAVDYWCGGKSDRWQFRLLRSACWFCGGEGRSILLAVRRDLKLDEGLMAADGRGPWFIQAALTFRVIFGGILPIVADGIWRLVRPAKAIREVSK